MGEKTTFTVDYGVDAPNVLRRFTVIGATGVLLGIVCLVGWKQGMAPWSRFMVHPFLNVGLCFLLTAAIMLWGSKIGKVRLRKRLIESLSLRGDERVLDVGCGHGLMLIGAAQRLTSGKAIGIDLWQNEDQAGNSREATWRNAQLEGVDKRVELMDGDARTLPFSDNTFDVVLSTWALHNIYEAQGRLAAIHEIVRVLKPGGRVVIVDIRHTRQYARVLEQAQMLNIKRTGPNFLFCIPSFTLAATRPG